MPVVDSESRVVGTLLREDPETHNYSECLFVINFTSRLAHLYPPEADGSTDFTKFLPIEEIKCSYITKVNVALSRPKVLNCFEIVTTGVSRFFSVSTIEERDQWIEAIKQSSMSQSSAKTFAAATQKEKVQDFGYKNQVVGGVLQRKPIKENDALTNEVETSEKQQFTSSGPAAIIHHQTERIPRVIKAGQATKCGAVMKNWKRRFFVLSEESLGYYKFVDELEPIRSIPVSDMLSVGRSKIHASKDHLLELVTPTRTFYIQADNEADMMDWIKSFQSVISTLRASSQSLPVTAKERSSSNSDPPLVIHPYDASPKPIGIVPLLCTTASTVSSQHTELSNRNDCSTIGTEV